MDAGEAGDLITNDELDALKSALEQNDTSWDATIYGDVTLFGRAVRQKKADFVRLLLEHGADPNEDRQALEFLVRHLNPEVVGVLMEAGLDVLAEDDAGESLIPDILTSSSRDVDAIRNILEMAGPEAMERAKRCVATQPELFGRTPNELVNGMLDEGLELEFSDAEAFDAVSGSVEMIERLLEMGKSPKGVTTPLSVQARGRDRERARRLTEIWVEEGNVGIDSAEYNNFSALAEAVFAEDEELAIWLLDRGADPYRPVETRYRDHEGFTADQAPIDYADKDWRDLDEFVERAESLYDEAPDYFNPVQHPGFDNQTHAVLIYGRKVSLDDLESPAATAQHLAHYVKNWADGNDSSVIAIPVGAPREDVAGAWPYDIVVGVRLAHAEAGEGPLGGPEAVDFDAREEAAKRAYKDLPSDFWKGIDERLEVTFSGKRAGLYLVPAGPNTSAWFCHGVLVPGEEAVDAEAPGSLSYWLSTDERQEVHPEVILGAEVAVTHTYDGVTKVRVSEKKRETLAEANADLDDPRFLLAARYD